MLEIVLSSGVQKFNFVIKNAKPKDILGRYPTQNERTSTALGLIPFQALF